MIYFTADPHFDHKKIISMCQRPFGSVDEMNEALLDGINSTVKKRDLLIIIGDFAWRRIAEHRSKIQCKQVHLIWGNHDIKRKPCEEVFSKCYERATYKIGPEKEKVRCIADHYPHCFWLASHYGSLHVYGHHHLMREDYLDAIWPERRSMDVGLDVAYEMFGEYRPFSEMEIYERLMARKGHDPLDFYREWQAARAKN